MGILEMLVGIQQSIRGLLSADLAAFAVSRDWWTLAAVLPMGILFGSVHALTPGHGKIILASYLAGSRLRPLRGLAVSSVLAAVHVFSAVLLALLAAPLVTRTIVGVGRAPLLEHVSSGLLIAIGIWMLVRAWRGARHQHSEGLMVGAVAGLVPCPLTLFAMFFAMARGVPEAGLAFALAMMIGVGLTLGAVAAATVFARDRFIDLTTRHGATVEKAARVIDLVAGITLIAVSLRELT